MSKKYTDAVRKTKSVVNAKKLRRKEKNNPKNYRKTRGRINNGKTIHERNEQYPSSQTGSDYGYFEADTEELN